MEENEQFILVVIMDERGHTFHFTKTVQDNWQRVGYSYKEEGYWMVKDWVDIGYEIKAIVLVDRNPYFAISRIL